MTWHFNTQAKTSTIKKQPRRLLLHSNPKIAYFSKSIRGQWSHSSCTKRKQLTYYTEKSRITIKEIKTWRSQCKIPNLRKVHLHSERHEENILTYRCLSRDDWFFLDCHLEGNSNTKRFTNLAKKIKTPKGYIKKKR